MNNGIDYLGLGHRKYPIADIIRLTPKGTPIGAFFDTFGDVRKNLRKVLSSGKFPACRIHLWWSTAHIIAPLSVVKRGSKAMEKFAKEFPAVKFYVSHSCEPYETDKKTAQKRIDIIRKLAPSVIPVNCIAGKGAALPGVINENHPHQGKTSLSKPFIVSNDGRDILEMDAQRFQRDHKDAELCFLWTSRFNLRDPGETNPPPPKQRTKPPSKELIKCICSMLM